MANTESSVESSYRVERRHGCRLFFGTIPLRDMSALLLSGSDDGERIDLHLASVTGALLVTGKPDALARLREEVGHA